MWGSGLFMVEDVWSSGSDFLLNVIVTILWSVTSQTLKYQESVKGTDWKWVNLFSFKSKDLREVPKLTQKNGSQDKSRPSESLEQNPNQKLCEVETQDSWRSTEILQRWMIKDPSQRVFQLLLSGVEDSLLFH